MEHRKERDGEKEREDIVKERNKLESGSERLKSV